MLDGVWIGAGGGLYARGPASGWLGVLARLEVVAPLSSASLELPDGGRVYNAPPAMVLLSVGAEVEPF